MGLYIIQIEANTNVYCIVSCNFTIIILCVFIFSVFVVVVVGFVNHQCAVHVHASFPNTLRSTYSTSLCHSAICRRGELHTSFQWFNADPPHLGPPISNRPIT